MLCISREEIDNLDNNQFDALIRLVDRDLADDIVLFIREVLEIECI